MDGTDWIEQTLTLKFLSPTNAPLYYTYKMLKCTVRSSSDCPYMFRSTWTNIREPMLNLDKVTILRKNSVKIRRYMFSNVVVKCVSSCDVYCVPCRAGGSFAWYRPIDEEGIRIAFNSYLTENTICFNEKHLYLHYR